MPSKGIELLRPVQVGQRKGLDALTSRETQRELDVLVRTKAGIVEERPQLDDSLWIRLTSDEFILVPRRDLAIDGKLEQEIVTVGGRVGFEISAQVARCAVVVFAIPILRPWIHTTRMPVFHLDDNETGIDLVQIQNHPSTVAVGKQPSSVVVVAVEQAILFLASTTERVVGSIAVVGSSARRQSPSLSRLHVRLYQRCR